MVTSIGTLNDRSTTKLPKLAEIDTFIYASCLVLFQVTGGRDGCVRVWDSRVSDPVVKLEPREGEVRRLARHTMHSLLKICVFACTDVW